ncbi:hypothetical protein ACHAXA_000185 [Cyclostephanos tholiformis]|uniref:Uncharacterized protein n=1 Tax=Cyclostephanos tholiformis TaxID=382380 RepID=A0ABD3R0M8_9STRA
MTTLSCRQKENKQTKSQRESRDDQANADADKVHRNQNTKDASIKGGKRRPNPSSGKKSGYQTEHR